MRKYLLDGISLLIILSIIAGLWWRSDFLKMMHEDYSYHLLVAQNYLHAGGIVSWDNWESAPSGRPQNYPPLWQFLMSLFLWIPWSAGEQVVFFNLLAIGSCLTLAWLGIRLLYDKLTALLFLLITTTFIRYVMFIGIIVPASIVLAATPLLVYLVKNKRWFGAGTLFTLMLYTHLLYPWLILSAVIIWQVWVNRKNTEWKQLSATFGTAILLYLPWGLRVLQHLNYIKYTNPNYQSLGLIPDYYLNFTLVAIFAWALIYLINKRLVKKQATREFSFWVILLILQIPLLYTIHPSRFSLSGGAFAMVILSALALSELWRAKAHPVSQKNRRAWSVGIVIFLLLINITFLELASRQNDGLQIFSLRPSLYSMLLIYQDSSAKVSIQQMSVFTPQTDRLVKIIKESSRETEVILNTTKYFNLEVYPKYKIYAPAQLFGAISGRPIANPRNPELYWLPPFPIDQARIVIADLRQTNYYPGPKAKEYLELAKILEKDFTLVGQEDRVLIFKNKATDTFNIKPQTPLINTWLALFLLLGAIIIITRETILSRRPQPKP